MKQHKFEPVIGLFVDPRDNDWGLLQIDKKVQECDATI